MCAQVSARSWDHNECFAQFSGDHTLLTDGYSSVLHKLAQGLDIRLNTAVFQLKHTHAAAPHRRHAFMSSRSGVCLQVQHVDYSGEGVTVTSSCGSRWSAQKVGHSRSSPFCRVFSPHPSDGRRVSQVLVTAPLALLQKNVIGFSPPLPDRKLKAIHSLGAGVIEKASECCVVFVNVSRPLKRSPLHASFQVALQFPTRFWDGKIQGADYFGHVPPCPEKRGLFSVFYDMCPQVRRSFLNTR